MMRLIREVVMKVYVGGSYWQYNLLYAYFITPYIFPYIILPSLSIVA
jgi:hypothetical protein